jgi:large conductance mechanosensitive channel
MGFMDEFQAFIARGNVIELAVAFIIGGAFGKIVSSLVNDVVMPPIGLLLGGVDFTNMFIDLSGQGFTTLTAAKDAGAAVIAYGSFINTIIEFLIIAIVIFMLVRQINKMQKKEESKPAPPPEPSKEVVLLSEIRDLLKK